jgi:alkylated DNA nucleotide flippase Atl1
MDGTIRAKFRPARSVLASVSPEAGAPASAPRRARADRLARQLALAHWIERAIESGEVRSYGAVARALGLTQPRVTQVMALLFLAPTLQGQALVGSGLGIRKAMRVGREAEWAAQERFAPLCSLVSERDSNVEQFAFP